jgi:hypothetical protein
MNHASAPTIGAVGVGFGSLLLHQAWPMLLGGGLVVVCALLIRFGWRRSKVLRSV